MKLWAYFDATALHKGLSQKRPLDTSAQGSECESDNGAVLSFRMVKNASKGLMRLCMQSASYHALM
jgi:hypothetical protein